jgi:hypothetical protein
MRVFDSSGGGVVCAGAVVDVGVGVGLDGVCARKLETAPDNRDAVTTSTLMRSVAFPSVLIVVSPLRCIFSRARRLSHTHEVVSLCGLADRGATHASASRAASLHVSFQQGLDNCGGTGCRKTIRYWKTRSSVTRVNRDSVSTSCGR